ncbi:MAG: TolC family protein [Verrucomicrobiota bacterium]
MQFLIPNRRTGWPMLAAAVFVAAIVTGCTGFATSGEKAARKQAAASAQTYRPNGRKPELPKLTPESSLSNFLEFAMLNQPKVEIAYNDWMASIERITQARSLPDPQFTYQMDIQDVVTSIMPGVLAAIPWPAKLKAAASQATAESQSRFYAFQSAALQNAFEVKRAYYQLHYLSDKIRVNQDMLSLLNRLEALASAENQAGKVTLQDVLRAQIEQGRVRVEIANLEDSRSSLLAQFKAALGLGPADPDPPAPARFDSTPTNIDLAAVLGAALAQNTRLKSLAADVQAAEAALMMAEKSKLPDFSLGLMADAKMSPTLYRPLGTVSLPIWRDKIAARIAEAQADKKSAQARLSDDQIALAVDIAERAYVYRESTRNLGLLNEELLPKARQSFQMAQSSYLSGTMDIFNFTDTQRTLLRFELDRVDAESQREIVLAELSLIVQGMPPAGTSMAGARPASMNRLNPAANPAQAGGM